MIIHINIAFSDTYRGEARVKLRRVHLAFWMYKIFPGGATKKASPVSIASG
jgi:hypothetical protein